MKMTEDTTHLGTEGTDAKYELVKTWKPNTVDLKLEIGFSGVCNHCKTSLVKNLSSDDPRLSCPDCGYIAGLVLRLPSLDGGGEAGDAVAWPETKTDWEIDNGRATFDVGIRGEHINCGSLVTNINEGEYNMTTNVCCSNCEKQFAHAKQINTLVDPINDINHLTD